MGGTYGTAAAVPAAAANGVDVDAAEEHTAGAAAAGAGHGVSGVGEDSGQGQQQQQQKPGESRSAVAEDVRAGTVAEVCGPPEAAQEAAVVGDGEGEELQVEEAAVPSGDGGAGDRDAVDGAVSLPACEGVGEGQAGQPGADPEGSRTGETGQEQGAGGIAAAAAGGAGSPVEQEGRAEAAPPTGDSPAAAADAAAGAAGDTLPNGDTAGSETTATTPPAALTKPSVAPPAATPPAPRRRVLDVWSCLEAFFAAEAVTWECPRERAAAAAEAAAAGPSAGASLAATPQPSMSYRKQVGARGEVGTCPGGVLEGCGGMGWGVGGRCRCRVQCLCGSTTARSRASFSRRRCLRALPARRPYLLSCSPSIACGPTSPQVVPRPHSPCRRCLGAPPGLRCSRCPAAASSAARTWRRPCGGTHRSSGGGSSGG